MEPETEDGIIRFTVRLSKDVMDKLDAIAKTKLHGTTRSHAVRFLIEETYANIGTDSKVK